MTTLPIDREEGDAGHLADHTELARIHNLLDDAADDGGTAGVWATDGAGWLRKSYAALKTALSLVKADVGLESVDNTPDTGKPVSTAQATAIAAKVGKAGDTMTGPLVLPGDAASALQATPLQQVQALVAALVDSAPGTLNTLNELAAALSDDPDFATTMATLIGTKETPAGATAKVGAHSVETTDVHGIADTADLVLDDDGRLTNSRAPTGTAGGVLGGTYPNPSFAVDMATQGELDAEAVLRATGDTTITANTQTVDYTLVLADAGKVIEVNAATAKVVTVPTNAVVAFPTGTIIQVVQIGAGAVTVAGAGVTFDGGLTMLVRYGALLLRKRATDEWVVQEVAPSSTYLPLAGGTMTGELVLPDVKASGKTGATATPITLAGGTVSGAPTAGVHIKGELVLDDTGTAWYCTVAGTPGTWVQVGVGWQQRVNDAAAALTDWTTVSGTWAASGGVFTQSGTTAAYGVIRHNNDALGGAWILEARIRFPTSGQAGSGTLLAGIGFGHSGVAGNETVMPSVRLSRPFNSTAGAIETVANNGALSITGFTLALDTFYKLRVEAYGGVGRIFIDGVEAYAASWALIAQRFRYPFVYTNNAKADFDDIKVWTLTSGAPA